MLIPLADEFSGTSWSAWRLTVPYRQSAKCKAADFCPQHRRSDQHVIAIAKHQRLFGHRREVPTQALNPRSLGENCIEAATPLFAKWFHR